jgi:hypothetical protein
MVTDEQLIRVGDTVTHVNTPKIEGEVIEVQGEDITVRWDKPRTIGAFGIQLTETVKAGDLSLSDPDEAFWRSVPPGTVLHYHSGHQLWMQGVLTILDGEVPEPRFEPQTLLGPWSRPFIDHNGQLREDAAVKKVREGRTFRPHYSNIFESGVNPRFFDLDLKSLERAELTPAPLTLDQLDIVDRVQSCHNDITALKGQIDTLRVEFYKEAE